MKIPFTLLLFFSILAAVLHLPSLSRADSLLVVEGVIGDCAPQGRIYEIKGKMYLLPNGLIIEDSKGKRLNYNALQPGKRIKIYGRKLAETEPYMDENESQNIFKIDGQSASYSPDKIIVFPALKVKKPKRSSVKKDSREVIFENGVWHN